jgi:membrane protease YdiL (CAAX protease family)
MSTTPTAEPRRHVGGYAPGIRPSPWWTVVAAIEVVLAAVAVILDLAIPTFVILALMVLSLLVRRQGPASLGFHRAPHGLALTGKMLLIAAGWTLVTIGLLKPIENHLTGSRQDMSQFDSLQGSVPMLLSWTALSWVVAALGETTAFFGYVQTRLTEVVGSNGVRLGFAIVVSAVLLGMLHTEYGIVGIATSAIDGILYGVLRWHYKTLWAPILAHGFANTIGFVSFFLVGPIYGLW